MTLAGNQIADRESQQADSSRDPVYRPEPLAAAIEGPGRAFAIRATNLTRCYAQGRGVRNASLAVAWGQVLGVIGANASGKSTLLKCLAMFEKPSAGGSLLIDGQVWVDDGEFTCSEARINRLRGQTIGCVFQNQVPWPHRTVLEGISLPLRVVLGLPAAQARERAERALAEFGVLDRAGAAVWELSGGLQQRVVWARTIALQPRILLIDEGTSALDPDWTERLRLYIRQFADAGGAVIHVSHRLQMLRRCSDEVIFLDGGEIVERGAPGNVLESPRSDRLRKFLENA